MSRSPNFLRRSASVLIAGLLTAALGSAAQAADKVKVAVFPVSSALPYFVALERGYFADAGIEVELVKLLGGPPIISAMITNQVDAASNLVTLEGMNANTKKPGVVNYISMNGQNSEFVMEQFVVGEKYKGAKSVADLKGAKIMSAPGPANREMARQVLFAAGLKEGDFTLDAIGMGDHVGAMKAGTFDAGYTLEPSATVMMDTGAAKVLETGVISKYLLGGDSHLAFAAGGALTGEFMEKRPDVAKRFAEAWAKAIKDTNEDPTVRDLLPGNTFTPESVKDTIPMVSYKMTADLTDQDKADIQKFVDLSVEAGIFEKSVDTSKYLTKF